MKHPLYLFIVIAIVVILPVAANAENDSTYANQRKGYDQREFTFVNQYNQMLWKFLRAVDEVKDGHYKSNLTWSTDRYGKITSLMPDVDNSLFTGQSMLRTLNNDRRFLTQVAFDDRTHRLTELFQQSVENAQEGVDEILKYYATPWKVQTEAQAGEVQKKGGWTKVWEAMRDMVTKSRQFVEYLDQMESPKLPYVEANVVTDLLPPVLQVPVTPPGSPFFNFWYNVGAPSIVIAEPLQPGTPLMVGDVILGVYKFGSITVNGETELDPTSGAERTLIETPSIVEFAKTCNGRMNLAEKTFRLLVRREGKEIKVDVQSDAAGGGNIFQR